MAVAVGTALVITLLIVHNSLSEGMIKQGSQYDVIAGAEGSPTQLMLSTVFHYEAPIGNIPYDVYDRMKNNPKVDQAIPLALGDNFQGFRIVGTTTEYFQDYQLSQALEDFHWEEGEVILGSKVARATGLNIGDKFKGVHGITGGDDHGHDFSYTVIGILEVANNGDDIIILTPIESVWSAHEDHEVHEDDEHEETHEDHGHDEDHEDDHEHDESDRKVTAILLKVNGIVNQLDVTKELNSYSGVQGINTIVVLRQLLSTIGNGAAVANLLAYTGLFMAIISILISLLSSMNERRKDAATLRLLGCRKNVVLQIITLEAMTLVCIGTIVGIGTAHLGSYFLGNWITEVLGAPINSMQIVQGEVAAILLIILLGLVAGIVSGISVYKTQPTTFLE